MKPLAEPRRPLPEWLLCKSADRRLFLVHLEWPRLILELQDGGRGEIAEWFDAPALFVAQELDAGRDPGLSLARLMRAAGEFVAAEVERSRAERAKEGT